ncbi:MAG TPA: START domain-containing protein [Polyangiaceae bacterium]|nr:START domain-containing protein [Polyangiaceae bacterium]
MTGGAAAPERRGALSGKPKLCAWTAAGALGVLCVFGRATADDDAGWRVLAREQGITVTTRDEPGSGMLSFRGQGNVKGPVLQLLAIIIDDARAPQWAKNADESKLLKTVDMHTQIVYSRSDQPWPVRDRDLVMKRTIEVRKPGEEYRVRLVCIQGEKPELPSVVRIGRCETVFQLRKADDATTFVDYRVRVDPGGGNPDWLVRMASKSIPLETLLGLRRQVDKTKGQYEAVMRQWANDAG